MRLRWLRRCDTPFCVPKPAVRAGLGCCVKLKEENQAMAKFIMECPNCGRYVEAKTGFFARKKIDCTCGYTINVKTEKLAARTCPHCGNEVVFDQSKGEKALCPVCHEPINTQAEQTKMEEFSCGQCGVGLMVNKGAATYACPVCDFVNDVPERLMAEKIRREGLASIIKLKLRT